jgi:hypothetical protein
MAQKQLEDTGLGFLPLNKRGYCCTDASCIYFVHTYQRCKVCGRPCPGCTHDNPEKRRRF